MELLVNFLHKVGKFNFILVAFLDKHLRVILNDSFTLILHLSVPLDLTVNLMFSFVVDLIELNVVVLAMLGVLDDCISAQWLLTSLAVEENL